MATQTQSDSHVRLDREVAGMAELLAERPTTDVETVDELVSQTLHAALVADDDPLDVISK